MQNVEFPTKLECLFDPKPRYIVLYGGRGGLKSWSIARALLIRAANKPMRVLCAREIMQSIGDSVHHLLKEQISLLNLDGFYQVFDTEIRGNNGSQFIFAGLKHQVSKIKSFEAIDIAWIEEAANVSKSSWDTLDPTIRNEGSQIMLSFNPELLEDETYQRFVVSPPQNCVVVKTTYRDNPWLSDVLKQEMEECKRRRPQDFENIWEGNPRTTVEGAIFSNEMHKAVEEGRIRSVPYVSTVPVHTFWDLGHSDQTAIWFAQMVGFEYHILRYYSNSREKMQHYMKYLQDLPYVYGTHYLPHDAAHEQLGQEKTIEQQAQAILKNVMVVPRVQSKANSIEAARSVFPLCYFDKDLCADGLSCLRRYSYAVNPETEKISKEPQHDMWSHGADAFQGLAMAMETPRQHKYRNPPLGSYDPYQV